MPVAEACGATEAETLHEGEAVLPFDTVPLLHPVKLRFEPDVVHRYEHPCLQSEIMPVIVEEKLLLLPNAVQLGQLTSTDGVCGKQYSVTSIQ